LIIWSFSISIAVRLQKITGNAKPRVYYCQLETSVFFSRYPHLSFISLIHNPLILRSVFLSRALYNLSHLYYPLCHFRDVFLCFQILFITKALFFKCFKHDFRNNKL
jgi:hypothetical protein